MILIERDVEISGVAPNLPQSCVAFRYSISKIFRYTSLLAVNYHVSIVGTFM